MLLTAVTQAASDMYNYCGWTVVCVAALLYGQPNVDGFTVATVALDEGDLACLVLLDLSATFDTVDHEVLLQRFHITYGVNGVAHDWFRSYLIGRHQYVRVRAS